MVGSDCPYPIVLVLDRKQRIRGIRFHYHMVALSNADEDGVSIIGLDGDKVRLYNLENVLVDRKDEGSRSRSIDQSQKVLSTSRKHFGEDWWRISTVITGRHLGLGAIVIPSAIQNVCLQKRWVSSNFFGEILECTVVAPVTEHEGLHCFIVIRCGWPMESKRPCKSIGILGRVMTMIPRCAILRDFELVCELIIRCDWALRYRVNTIVLERVQQSHSVPVNRGTVVVQLIDDCDFDLISPTGLNEGSGVSAVEGFAAIAALIAIRVDWVLIDVQCILSRRLLSVKNHTTEIVLALRVMPIGA